MRGFVGLWVGIYKRSGTAYIGSIPPSPPPQFHHNHSTPLHKSTTDRLEPLLPLFLPPRATIVGCSPFLTPNPTLLIPQPFSLLICNPTLPTHQRKTQKIYLSRFVGKKKQQIYQVLPSLVFNSHPLNPNPYTTSRFA